MFDVWLCDGNWCVVYISLNMFTKNKSLELLVYFKVNLLITIKQYSLFIGKCGDSIYNIWIVNYFENLIFIFFYLKCTSFISVYSIFVFKYVECYQENVHWFVSLATRTKDITCSDQCLIVAVHFNPSAQIKSGPRVHCSIDMDSGHHVHKAEQQ